MGGRSRGSSLLVGACTRQQRRRLNRERLKREANKALARGEWFCPPAGTEIRIRVLARWTYWVVSKSQTNPEAIEILVKPRAVTTFDPNHYFVRYGTETVEVVGFELVPESKLGALEDWPRLEKRYTPL